MALGFISDKRLSRGYFAVYIPQGSTGDFEVLDLEQRPLPSFLQNGTEPQTSSERFADIEKALDLFGLWMLIDTIFFLHPDEFEQGFEEKVIFLQSMVNFILCKQMFETKQKRQGKFEELQKQFFYDNPLSTQ